MNDKRKNLKTVMVVYVPFDIQAMILKKLPVKSLIRFLCVSKRWKSLISSSEFIKNYQTMNDHHLLVRYNVLQPFQKKKDTMSYNTLPIKVNNFPGDHVSIIDNDTFPEHMSPITVPVSVKTLSGERILGSSYGIICFHGYHKDYSNMDSEMVVFWNPSIRKSVSVWLKSPVRCRASWVGFGVCPETCDPKLVKIDDVGGIPEAEVYTLSTQAWKKVSVKSPYKPCGKRHYEGVCVEGFIYWLARDDRLPPIGDGSNSIVSFDLSNDEFGKVYLPCSLQRSERLMLSKWNECLIVCDHHQIYHWDVWMMKDDSVTQPFTMMFSIDSIFRVYDVLDFRKNGEAIIDTIYAQDNVDLILQIYDPCSGRLNDIRIPFSGHNDIGKTFYLLSASSYMETLLLLDQ